MRELQIPAGSSITDAAEMLVQAARDEDVFGIFNDICLPATKTSTVDSIQDAWERAMNDRANARSPRTDKDAYVHGSTVYNNEGVAVGQAGGLTKREHFAAMAIPTILGAKVKGLGFKHDDSYDIAYAGYQPVTSPQMISEAAVRIADALIEALNK